VPPGPRSPPRSQIKLPRRGRCLVVVIDASTLMVTDATMHDQDDTGLLAQLGPVAILTGETTRPSQNPWGGVAYQAEPIRRTSSEARHGPCRGDAPGSQRAIEIVHRRGRKVVTDGTGSGQGAGNQPGPSRRADPPPRPAATSAAPASCAQPAGRLPLPARAPSTRPGSPVARAHGRAKLGVSQQAQQGLGRPAIHTAMVPRPRPDSGIPRAADADVPRYRVVPTGQDSC
jgi:hypothetical protein